MLSHWLAIILLGCSIYYCVSDVTATTAATTATTAVTASATADDYYKNIDPSQPSDVFKKALHTLIANHSSITYSEVWGAYKFTDHGGYEFPNCTSDQIGDKYSSYCWIYSTKQCGNYKKEGDCYNREHSWAQSWWDGDAGGGAQSDLFHLFPTDGYVNNRRNNYPFCVVGGTPAYVSTNGGKLGKSATAGYTGTCFEPTDQYKGDFARALFYMSVAYMDKWTCCETDGTNNSHIKPWFATLLRGWHDMDAVSQYEIDRTDVIYNKYQGNRNPFIDHPEWVRLIDEF